MQARLALEHGKRVFLLKSLVTSYPWARQYLNRGAIRVDSVDDILRYLRSPESVREEAADRKQLALDVF
jgi:DNA processing protein